MNRMSVWTVQKYQVSSCYPNSNKHQWYRTHTAALVTQWGLHTRGQFSDNMNVPAGETPTAKVNRRKRAIEKKNGRGPFPSKVIAESRRATSGCLGMNHVIVLNWWTHALLPFPTPATSSQGHCPNLFILSRPPVCTCQGQWRKKTRNESLETLKNLWLSYPPFFPSFFFFSGHDMWLAGF